MWLDPDHPILGDPTDSYTMKFVSWNIRGLKDISKRLTIKRLLKKLHSDVVMLQQSKLEEIINYVGYE